eukprot:TRINITY_DN624_c0_g1_i1.p1 TRINITY_DN624_c0_g1~~TRINITY_DN624_c0_g1_i1.p1  ORF type:complete len:260 (+),score=1.70 TRINITY_DN624_c0_g1_i1:98-877(+)
MSDRGNTVVYVGRLSSRTRERDLEDAFNRYGRVSRLDLKAGYAFVEYSEARDAEDAIRGLDGTDLDGSRIAVEPSHRGEGRCFTCGKEGHWARDCRDGRGGGGRDSRSRGCFVCGDPGHFARECRNPRSRYGDRYHPYGSSRRRHSRSRSRSPRRRSRSRDSRSPRRSPRRDSRSPRRSPRRDSRSPRRSASPRRDSRSPRRDSHSRTPRRSVSRNRSVSAKRDRSPSPKRDSPRGGSPNKAASPRNASPAPGAQSPRN